MKLVINSLLMLSLGAGAGYLATSYLADAPSPSSAAGGKAEPLYWVAPMDPNYKRDKPGLSPMGMELIPVYEEDLNGGDDAPGTVAISPEVINNLGVRTAPIAFGPLQAEIRSVGYVGFDEDLLKHLHSRVEGWIQVLHVKSEGEYVAAGQPVYELYAPTLVNAQEEYLAARRSNNRLLQRSARDKLRALGVSDEEIKALARRGSARQTIVVRAESGGYVSQLNVREGMFIKPALTLMSIGPLDQVWVTAEVFERQAAWLQVGQRASMQLDYAPGREWQGTVDYIYPVLDAKTRTVKVRLRFDNPDQALKPNMFARLDIAAKATDATLHVPAEAVIRTGSQQRVVVALGDGKFKSVAVELGPQAGDRIAINAGLLPDDQVVTSAQFLLDSESSISSDFQRMAPRELPPETVWTRGIVRSVNPDSQLMTISHDPVDAWQWPAMTMDFQTQPGLALNGVKTGQEIHFEMTRSGNSALVSAIHIPDQLAPAASGGMDHSQHQGMNHGMDQSAGQGQTTEKMPAMDHSQHQGMNHGMDQSAGQGQTMEKMPAMDHSQHQGMNHGMDQGAGQGQTTEKMPAMDHSQHQGMNHGMKQSADQVQSPAAMKETPAMDHSQHQGMNHGMDQSAGQGQRPAAMKEMPAMDHSQHQGMDNGGAQ
ncbi:efflux RND transporter periplasmic adaptor subunit [Marinobacterium arenosum]|uniref:efflux RND transporter periplasmic adaptor subunit n=1 Tax=Marinobacterium arenosum TaxID=2862496 RepID=UPI001C95870C|nr:efflux RND transporter periplasmic adaptor subunit [Marinobacterium arenosum]MBY4677580.1 efflux RND transporter periplasmic adaptor subunit [Marinobacterium arenosum]